MYFISPFFSLSSQRGEDGERRRKQKTFDFGHAELPRYTAIDAVGWVGPLLISPIFLSPELNFFKSICLTFRLNSVMKICRLLAIPDACSTLVPHSHSILMTVETMFSCRALLQFCSCRSAEGSILSSLQGQSTLQPLEQQLIPSCTSVATESC